MFLGCEQFFRPGYIANLVSSWIPALDGVDGKLRSGAKVADIGCGLGASTILLAREYPNSAFSGSDYHDRSIEIARKRAGDAGTNSALTGNPLTVCEGCLAFFVTVSGQILGLCREFCDHGE